MRYMYNKLEHNIPESDQHKYHNERLAGFEIDLTVKKAVHVFQNCDIEDCRVRIKSNSNCTPNILSSNRWLSCAMWPSKELSLNTIEADFINCQFKGTWSGRIKGKVDNCNFSDANLLSFAFYDINSVGSNTFSGKDTVIIENAGTHHKEIKDQLSGKSNFGLHIRPDMGLYVFNIREHKDSTVLMELLPELPYVKFAEKA